MIPKSQILFPGQSGHRFSVMRLAAFHHSNKIASCSFDGTVRIWEDKKQQKTLFFFTEAIESLEITPNDAKIIVVLSDSSKAFIHDIIKEETQEIGQGKLFRNIFGTNPSSTKTAFVTFDDEVFIYNHVNNSLSSHTNVENISGDSLAWLDDDLFCIPKRNGCVAIIDSNTRGIKGEPSLHDGLITSIVKNGEEIITVSEDGTGKVHDLTFEPKFGFKIPFTPQSVCYSLKDRLVVVSGDRNLLFVDTTNGQLTNTDQELSGCNPIITNNSEIYRGSGENDISQFSNTGEIIAKMSGRSKTAESIVFLNKKSIVYGSGDGNVYLLNYFDNEEKQLTNHSESVSSIIHLRGSNRIIAGSFDDSISIWDLNQQTEIKRIPNVPLVTTLALSPSNALFVAGCSGDNSIHVFKADGEKITSWEAHDDFISVVSFLNDEVIVSGSDDKTIRFWNTSGKLISTLNVSASVKSIYTASESEFIVVGLENGELLLYEKLSNRKIISHKSSSSIQCIRMVNSSLIYFAAKNILYQMRLDGPNIIDITDVCQHEEPVRGIKWIPNEELIISFDHSIQIMETRFTYEERTTELIEDEEDSPTTVVFVPEDPSTEEAYQHAVESDHESLTSILEYLNTVSTQVTTLVLPRLLEMGINAEQLVDSLQELENKISEKLNQTESRNNVEVEDQEEEMSPDKESEWKEFDWGTKRH
jgi:WD40 repeat protein